MYSLKEAVLQGLVSFFVLAFILRSHDPVIQRIHLSGHINRRPPEVKCRKIERSMLDFCGIEKKTAYAPPPVFSIGKLTKKLSDGVLKVKKEHSPKMAVLLTI